MFRSLWFHKLLALSSRSQRRRQAAQQRKPVRMHLESLEDRVTPATAVTLNAINAAQLQADVTIANSDTTHSYVITLTGASPYNLTTDVHITNKLGVTIQGTGQAINAAPNSRDFTVEKGASATFKNVIIEGGNVFETTGSSPGGGGIADLGGNVTLSGATVQTNLVSAFGGMAQGGGVYVSGKGSLTVINSQIRNNKALGSAGSTAGAQGGGVYVTGASSLTISGSTVSGNIAQGANPSVTKLGFVSGGGGSAQGGGVYLAGGSTLSITTSPITANLAQGGNSGAPGVKGGFAEGGGVYASTTGNAGVSLTSSPVTGNFALAGAGKNAAAVTKGTGGAGGAGGLAAGGGLFVTGDGGTLTITTSPVTSNEALGGAGGAGGKTSADGKGGGAGGAGGSVFGGGLFVGTVFAGGGVGTAAVNVQISASPFGLLTGGGNIAQAGSGGAGAAGDESTAGTGGAGGAGGAGGKASGGGLWVDSSVPGGVIVNSSATNNQANAGNGGAGGAGGGGKTGGGVGGAGGAGGDAAGGGATFLGTISLVNSTMATNQASAGVGGGGGAGGATTAPGGGPIAKSGAPGAQGTAKGGGIEVAAATDVELINNTVFGNLATGGPLSTGGGINVDSLGGANLINNLVLNNGATGNPFIGAGEPDIAPDVFSGIGGAGNLDTDDIPPGGFPVVGSPMQTTNGVVFYPLLPGSIAIDGGNNGALGLIARAEGVPFNPLDPTNIKDIVGNPRVTSPLDIIDVGAVEFVPTQFTTIITFLNTSPITINTSAMFQPLTVEVQVSSSGGRLVTEGNVSFQITDSKGVLIGGPTPGIPSGTPGLFTGVFSIPANIKPGTYTITAVFNDPFTGPGHGQFAPATATTTLIVNPSPIPASTTLTPGSASVTTSASAQPVGITVLITSPNGTVGTGTVTVNLLNSAGAVIGTGSANVSGGAATVTVTVPAGLAPGSYVLQESYHDASGAFADASGFGTLTVASKGTTLTAGNGSVTFSAAAQPAGIPVLVTSPTGVVNQGVVTVTLFNNGKAVATGSNTVSNGSTVVTITVPAGLAAGSYTLVESYHDAAGVFADASAFGQLTVSTPPASPPPPSPIPLPVVVANNAPVTVTNPPSQFTALISLFVDGAILALDIKQGLDTTGIIQEMQTLLPFAGPLGPLFELAGFSAIMKGSSGSSR